MPITQELKTYLSRLTRKLILRGRSATGFYSMEGYRNAPNEPEQTITAQRAQHYGFVSEPPEGAEVIAVAINGGASNRAAIAEYVQGTPEIGLAEVALWARYGQLVLLNDDSEISLDNGDGGSVVISSDTTTVTDDLAVVRDLAVGRDGTVQEDLSSGHLIGLGSAPSVSAGAAIGTGMVSIAGHDQAFTITFSVVGSPAPPPGVIATITFARPFTTKPHIGISVNSPSLSGPTNGITHVVTTNSIQLSSTTEITVSSGYEISVVVIG